MTGMLCWGNLLLQWFCSASRGNHSEEQEPPEVLGKIAVGSNSDRCVIMG